MIITNPYLSIVVTARNDNFGGNLLHRLQLFLNNLMELVEKHNLHTELIIVEWNPQENKAYLKEVLSWMKKPKLLDIRIIQVLNEVHRTIIGSERMPFFEYIGKNVGIFRAKGDFVLATNPDIIFNDELFNYFATKNLIKNAFYRLSRYNVEKAVPSNFSLEARLKFCDENIDTISAMNIEGKKLPISYRTVIFVRKFLSTIYTKLTKVFKIMKEKLFNIKNQKNQNKIYTYTQHNTKISGLKLKSILLFTKSELKDFIKLISSHILNFLEKTEKISFEAKLGIHASAAGDFTLMSRENWHKLWGYPELKSQSFIDGYILFMALAINLKQIILEDPMRIYHQGHSISQRLNRPFTNYENYMMDSIKMLKTHKLLIYNDENWGLSDISLNEIEI